VRFTEINLLGVYVAPMSVMLAAAWFVTIWFALERRPLRRVAFRLAPLAVSVRAYMIVLSMVVVAAR
jgi:hypothetical protein